MPFFLPFFSFYLYVFLIPHLALVDQTTVLRPTTQSLSRVLLFLKCRNRLMKMKCTGDERKGMKSGNGRLVPLTIVGNMYQIMLMVVVATAMVGPRSWIGGLFTRSNRRNDKFVDYPLTPLQERRLQRLQDRLLVPFDETRPDHQEALKALWHAAFPNVALKGLISEQWKDMGWQGPNPSTDFRGCGFISLENLLFYTRTYPASFRRLLFKQGGKRATWEYPFAVAGINISFMLIQMLELQSTPKPKCVPGMNFLKLLGEDEKAFDVLYCIAFEMMDAQWLAMHASYMNFNEVLQATRNQLERELSLDDIHRIQDLPAYNLLYQ